MGMFSAPNTKLKKLCKVPELGKWLSNKRKIFSFDLLSGHSCPFANECHSKVIIENEKRKVQDGENTRFRCFSASQEALYTNVYDKRSQNFQNVRKLSKEQIIGLIQSEQPAKMGICRIHVAGDFFSQAYFDAWLWIARTNPSCLYYAYTKSLPFWVKRLREIPPNMVLTASRGGRKDKMIREHGLREAVVVLSESEAADLQLEIDHDDSHAANPHTREIDFALLIHGIQPKGSEAGKAVHKLKKR